MFIERGKTDCWLWQSDPDDAPNKDALMACRNPLCCNPRHIVEKRELKHTLHVIENEVEKIVRKRGRPPKNGL